MCIKNVLQPHSKLNVREKVLDSTILLRGDFYLKLGEILRI